jgi:hypothetical protein
MRFPPIAIMSFNRPAYLRQVLRSLADQHEAAIGERDLFLFQDGAVNAYSGRVCAEQGDIDASVAAFREIFPRGHLVQAEHNLGVAENFLRAERLFFTEIKADCGYFFEDDMVLAPRYLRIMDHLREATADRQDIGYFACYGSLMASAEDQLKRLSEILPIGHFWGFGLHRRHWEEMQPYMQDYYDLVCGRDYKARPHQTILGHFRARGIMPGVSSQDDTKKAVTLAMGRVGVNTFVVNARYIGEVGLHQNKARFEAAGYNRTVWIDGEMPQFGIPAPEVIEQMRLKVMADRQRGIATAEAAAAEAAKERQAAIEARQAAANERRAAAAAARAQRAAKAPKPAESADTASAQALNLPRMSKAELALLEKTLAAGAKRYAEFGSGGSTRLAALAGFDHIVSVESDPAWADKVRADPDVAAAIRARRASVLHADIGPVGAWGNPADRSALDRWPGYIACMWEEWDRRGCFPELVLVDGRFRVACATSVALAHAARGGEPPVVMLHDVSDRRPGYRRVFDCFTLVEQAESLCLLTPRRDVAAAGMLARLLRLLFDRG